MSSKNESRRLRRRMTAARWVAILSFLTVLAPATATAEEELRGFALTISPLHLIWPVVELTGELRVAPKVGIAALAGVGRMKADATDASGNVRRESFDVFELGASVRYYAVGDFDHGMQLGAELLYLHVDLDGQNVSGTAGGTAFGPFIGYKITTDAGFTFDSQLGFQYINVQGDAESEGLTGSGEESGIIPLLNLNIGWAF